MKQLVNYWPVVFASKILWPRIPTNKPGRTKRYAVYFFNNSRENGVKNCRVRKPLLLIYQPLLVASPIGVVPS